MDLIVINVPCLLLVSLLFVCLSYLLFISHHTHQIITGLPIITIFYSSLCRTLKTTISLPFLVIVPYGAVLILSQSHTVSHVSYACISGAIPRLLLVQDSLCGAHIDLKENQTEHSVIYCHVCIIILCVQTICIIPLLLYAMKYVNVILCKSIDLV